MPVVFNEPLTFLQRMCEYMEYARLLREASEQDDAVERMKYVAGRCLSTHSITLLTMNQLELYVSMFSVGFAVSALASNWERLGKPFNPLLGETYEYKNSEFRVICEQVIWVAHSPSHSLIHIQFTRFTGIASSTDFSISC